MATKKEFLNTTREYINDLRKWLSEITESSSALKARKSALQSERAVQIERHVSRLLPDLSDGTLAKLERTLPGFMSAAEIKALVSDEEADCADQLARLAQDYDPATAASKRMTLETELESLTDDAESVNAPVERFEQIPGFLRLVRDGYKTDRYGYSWLEGQYYRDWQQADQIVKAAGLKSWEQMIQRYNDAKERATALNRSTQEAQDALDALDGNAAAHNELTQRQGNIAGAVIERVQVALKGHLDTLHPLPDNFSDLRKLDESIAEIEAEQATVHESREKIMAQILELEKVEKTVQRSRSATVPDEYFDEIRRRSTSYNRSRQRGGSGGGSGHSTVIVTDDSWMINAILYQQMFDHFSHDSHSSFGSRYDDGPRDTYRSPSYEEAANDVYGRSS